MSKFFDNWPGREVFQEHIIKQIFTTSSDNQNASRNDDFYTVLWSRVRLVEICLLSVVPILLVSIYVLPQSLKQGVVLAYMQPTVITAFTAHFVHFNLSHLMGNIEVYTLVVFFTYVFSLLSNRRERFFLAYIVFFVIYPFVLSGLNVLLVRPRTGYGFSGINMAFVGLLPVIFIDYVSVQFDERYHLDHAPLLFFTGVGIIAALTVPSKEIRILLSGVSLIICLFYIRTLLRDLGLPSRSGIQHFVARTEYATVGIVGLVIFIGLVLLAFPEDPAGNGTVLNLYSHFLGYCFGFIVPYTTFRISESRSKRVF